MQLRQYIVDAFSDGPFTGNPAAVCPLDSWLPDNTMQLIAMENNLSETAFYVKEASGYRIRWFTPALEVDLCGHATLATAFVMFHHENVGGDKIVYQSRSGPLTVTRSGDLLTLDFPADTLTPLAPGAVDNPFRESVTEIVKGKTDFLFRFADEDAVRNCKPDFQRIAAMGGRGVIITAPGKQTDFVSRFFGPQAGVPEDPVTGSAHTTLTPYWSSQTGKTSLTAAQLSSRGGKLWCRLEGSRVHISGKARLFSRGEIFL